MARKPQADSPLPLGRGHAQAHRHRLNAAHYGLEDGDAADDAIETMIADADSDPEVCIEFPPGRFELNEVHEFPAPVDLLGAGRMVTQFDCQTADSGIRIGNTTDSGQRGGVVGHFTVLGNDTATNPLYIGRTSSRTFESIRVDGSADTGILCEKPQNSKFDTIEVVNSGGNGWVWDVSANANTIIKPQIADSGGYNLVFQQTVAATMGAQTETGLLWFYGLLSEQNGLGNIYHGAGQDIHFIGGKIRVAGGGDTGITIRRDNDADPDIQSRYLVLDSLIIEGTAAVGQVAVDIRPDSGISVVYVTGRTRIINCETKWLVNDRAQIWHNGTTT